MSDAPSSAAHRIDAELLLQQGVQAAQSGQPGRAAQCWQGVLSLCGDADLHTQAYFNLGVLCRRSGNAAGALACLREALLADQDNHEAREQLADLLAERGELDEAVAEFERLSSAQPEARHHFNLGILYSRRGDSAAAERHYRAALAQMPAHADSLGNLGLLLAERGIEDEALACLKRAAELASPQAHANLARILEAGDQLDVAVLYLERALDLSPDDAELLCDLAVVQVEQRRLEEAEAGFRRALAINPQLHRAATFLGQLLLAQGRYAEGWRLHEARFGRRQDRPLLPALSTLPWQGEPLAGKTLLLRQEQGFGDEIQFIRYLPRLQALGPACIHLQCWSALHPLFADLPGVELHAETAVVPSHDFWISTMSLPLHCGVEVIPAQLPYLQAPPERVAEWARRIGPPSSRLRVGLLWQGHKLHANDVHRSLVSVDCMAPLLQVPADFFSLQRDSIETDLPLHQSGSAIADFGDAAALIMQMDLIISVDSAYAHLAGALGKPVWVLLPACRTDWRWGYTGEASAWYPDVMRLFRQARRGDWDTVLARVAAALQVLAAERPV